MEINKECVFLKNESNIYTDSIKSEIKTEIDSSSVTKIIGVLVKPICPEGELKDGKVKYKSKIICSVCYVDSEKNLRKSEQGGEINGEIEGVNLESGFVEVEICPEKNEVDLSGINATVNVTYSVKVTVSEQKKSEYCLSGENLIINNQECEYFRGYGKRKTVFEIEEEFTLNYGIKNVLMHKATPVLSGVQCGVGCIIVDGNVYISALLLQNDENRNIIKETKTIPFRAEIDYDEAMPIFTAIAEVFERSFKTDISVDEETNTSTVTASISLLLSGEAFSKNTVNVSTDAFSTVAETECKIKVEEKCKPLPERFEEKTFDNKPVFVSDVENAKIIACLYERAVITDIRAEDTFLNIDGVVSFTVLFKTEDGDYITRKADSDFSSSIDIGQDAGEYDVKVAVISVNANKMVDNQINCEYKLLFSVIGQKTEKVQLLNDVNLLGEKTPNNSSISVYIALQNEDLWSLSKRLNTPPEEICNLNNDLQFPLSGKERIVIYRQKK